MRAVFFGSLLALSGCGTPAPEGGDLVLPAADLAAGQDGGGGCSPGCAGATPHCNAQRRCVPCLEDAHCPLGTSCKIAGDSATCATGCASDDRCRGDGGPGACCEGSCVDTASDPRHCGGCGRACAAVHARVACAAGQCQTGACDPGWGDCNGDAMDGCETNLRADPASCTACGMTCAIANAVAGCANGCYLSACKFGFDDCNQNVNDGCETQVIADARNCGGCGKSCANVPNATAGCVQGSCVIGQCNMGFANCDGNAGNGCETRVDNDVANCGACGRVCAQGLVCAAGGCTCPNCNIPNASARCVNNMCVLDQCHQGYANCDGNPANGCEVNVGADPKNCGACGTACPQNLPNCGNGVCTMAGVCVGNPKWTRVTCMTGTWVWSRDRNAARSVAAANAARVLASGCRHAGDAKNNDGMCSLDGAGWVSTKTFVMAGCDQLWWHLGGSYTGACGGHDGDAYRHLVTGDNDCWDYP